MRIVYLTHSDMPNAHAHSVNIARTSAALAAQGHDVFLQCTTRGSAADRASRIQEFYGLGQPIPAKGVRKSMIRHVGTHITAARHVISARLRHPDVCVGRNLDLLLPAAWAGMPVIYDAHFNPEELKPEMRRRFEQLLDHPRLLGVSFTSRGLESHFRSLYPGVQVVTVIAYNGAEAVASPVHAPSVRGLKVGYVGHLYPGKGMEVIGKLVTACPWASFKIVGGRPEDVARWQEKLRAEPNVEFTGHIAPGRVADIWKDFDVMLVPYQRQVGVAGGKTQDGRWITPIKLFEAMAAGKTVLVSDLDVAREVIRNGVNGFLCNPDVPQEWVDVLARLRDDPALVAGIGRAAWESAREKFSWNARARNILSLVDSGGTGGVRG